MTDYVVVADRPNTAVGMAVPVGTGRAASPKNRKRPISDTHVPLVVDREPVASAEEWAAIEFERMNESEIAFSQEGWSNFVGPAQELLLIAKTLLTQTKGELANIAKELMSPEQGRISAFQALLGDTADAASTFEKYARILRAAEARLIIAGTAFLETQQAT